LKSTTSEEIRGFTAVDDISFAVKDGEIFGLLGPKWSGGIDADPDDDHAASDYIGHGAGGGTHVARDPNAVRRTIGVIPQALTRDLDLTWKRISIFTPSCMTFRRSAKESDRRVAGDGPILRSGGTRKRRHCQAGCGGGWRSLGAVHVPRFFFLDEPTTGLDPVSRVAVWEMLTNH